MRRSLTMLLLLGAGLSFETRPVLAQDASAETVEIDPLVADPYPVADAVATTDPDETVPEPAPPVDIGLRPTSLAVAPIRSVARPVPPSAEPAGPVPGALPAPVDRETADRAAYDPVGLRLGSFQLDSAVSAGLGASSIDGGYHAVGGDIRLRSDWDRHGVDLRLRGDLRRSFDGDTEDPSVEAGVDGRLDLTEVDRIGAGLAYSLSREDDTSPELAPGDNRSDVHTLSATAGYERRAGLIGLDLRGAVDRTLYSGSDDRDATLWSASLRLTLESGAVLRPFVEAGAFVSRPDDETDSNGYRRAGVGGELKGGLMVDTGLVSGEVAVGYARERFDDPRLEDIGAVIGEAALVYAPTPLATVSLRGLTSIEPTSIAGASGSVTHSAALDLSYALRPNILLDTGIGLSYQDYVGVDRTVLTTMISVGTTWRLNRTVELKLVATREITDEGGPGADDSHETTVTAGVTVRP